MMNTVMRDSNHYAKEEWAVSQSSGLASVYEQKAEGEQSTHHIPADPNEPPLPSCYFTLITLNDPSEIMTLIFVCNTKEKSLQNPTQIKQINRNKKLLR